MHYKNLYPLQIFTLFLIYLLTARFGLSIHAVSGFATLIWLPSGISLAAMLIAGYKLWPGIFLGAFVANLITGAPVAAALGIGIGNTLESILGAYFLQKFQFRNSLQRLKDVMELIIIAALLCTLISALIGVSSLWLNKIIAGSAFINTFIAWWIGDMISILVVTPFILAWSLKPRRTFEIKKSGEFLVVAVFFYLIYLIVFENLVRLPFEGKSAVYLVFPPLIWVALRFGQKEVVTFNFLLSILTILSTLQKNGPFSIDTTIINLLSLQAFMAITTVTILILAAVINERRQTEQVKDEFISIAAHEFKTPITTMKGYIQLLDKYFKKSKKRNIKSYVFSMNTQIDNLIKLVTNLFDTSKIQSGKLHLEKEIFDIDQLVREIVKDMKNLHPNYKINIIGSSKKEVLADKYRISQVLINLVSNAIKFSPKKREVKIILSVKKSFILICVQDFGIGISPRDLNQVFERFFQAKTNIRPSSSGLGLGLYISSEIIKQHKERIWVKSRKGVGSEFSFRLPIIGN